MHTQTKETQLALTPQSVLEMMKEGNQRFLSKNMADRDHHQQVKDTSTGQYPMAVVLSCIDSRVPVEIVFDKGIGDIFSARVAGNIVNVDMLGSMEYSCKVAGSKVVIVLGHTKCGAVTAACKHTELGNITALLSKIMPAVDVLVKPDVELTLEVIEEVVLLNVKNAIEQIRKDSPILKEMEENEEIIIVGAVYDVASGEVSYL
ncbi:MAG: carbonic anhydrase [Saprospiraceae bacterium]|jgi:carbonic anhydrase